MILERRPFITEIRPSPSILLRHRSQMRQVPSRLAITTCEGWAIGRTGNLSTATSPVTRASTRATPQRCSPKSRLLWGTARIGFS